MLTEDILSIDFSSGRDGERLRNTDVRETHRTVASRPGLGIEPATQLHVPDWALNLQPFGPIVVCSIYWTTPASIIFQYYKTFFSFVHRFWERCWCETNIDRLPPVRTPTRNRTHNLVYALTRNQIHQLLLYRMTLKSTKPFGSVFFILRFPREKGRLQFWLLNWEFKAENGNN